MFKEIQKHPITKKSKIREVWHSIRNDRACGKKKKKLRKRRTPQRQLLKAERAGEGRQGRPALWQRGCSEACAGRGEK